MPIRCEVSGDGTHLYSTVSGRLRLTDSTFLRGHLLKCLAEQPSSLLVDLSGLDAKEPLALSVFTVVQRQAARWPGTPILLCGPPPATRAHLISGGYGHLPLFDDLDSARAHVHNRRRTMPSIREVLLPVAGATRHARDVTTGACLRWELPDLIAPASLIVTEMVANVVDHAHTMMTLHLSLRRRYLNIAVRDGSSAMPLPSAAVALDATTGRGLLLIGHMADGWGHLPTKDGKVVWAALRR